MYEELLVVTVEHLGFLYHNCEFTVRAHSKVLTEECKIRQNGFSRHKVNTHPAPSVYICYVSETTKVCYDETSYQNSAVEFV
jgi:hypothetical protein